MKEKIIISTILISFLLPVFTFGQENTDLPKPGLTPDSPFYFFDTFSKKVNLFFTFSTEKKAEKAIQFAGERLAEAKAMGERNKTKALASANQAYQEYLNLANQKTKEAKEKGKDVEELAILITEKTLKHQEVLIEVFEKVPEEAKVAIETAIQTSRRGSEEAVKAVSQVNKRDELLWKIEETKTKAEERITALERKIQTLEEKLEQKVAESEAEVERLKKEAETAKGEAEKARLIAEAEKAKAEAGKAKAEAETAKAEAERLKREAEEAKKIVTEEKITPLSLTNVSPNQILNNIDNYLTISGSGIQKGAEVIIGDVSFGTGNVINNKTLTIKIYKNILSTNIYSVQVINPDGNVSVLHNAFTIIKPQSLPLPTPPTQLSVVSQDTPATIQAGRLDTFAKIKFIGGSADTTITKIIVTRGGVSADMYVSYIELYDGPTKLDAAHYLNRNTRKTTFSSFSWIIPAGETKILDIKANIPAFLRNATIGESIILGINSASDITSSAPLLGDFPLMGNAKIITAEILIGVLDINAQPMPVASTIISGSMNQEIASWRFTANSIENINVQQIRITHAGSWGDFVKNIRLEVSGVQIGETVASLDNMNVAKFNLSNSLLLINANDSKIIYAYADIDSGVEAPKIMTFEITQYTDVTAYGVNSKELATVTTNNSRQIGNTMTINQGTLTVDIDADLNPSPQSYEAMSQNDSLLAAFKFIAGQEGIRVVRLTLIIETEPDAQINDISLWDGPTQIVGPIRTSGAVSYTTFTIGINWAGFASLGGLFDIPASSVKTIQVKATNVQKGSLSVKINDIRADGLKSKYDIPTENITIISGNGNIHTFE